MDNEFIEERRKFLQTFCQKMAELPHLYYSDEFKLFLKNPNVEIEKAVGALPKQSYEDILQKYQNNFKMLSGVFWIFFFDFSKLINFFFFLTIERNQHWIGVENNIFSELFEEGETHAREFQRYGKEFL